MGGDKTVQAKFGEVGDSPPLEIVAAGSTAAFMAVTKDVPNPLPGTPTPKPSFAPCEARGCEDKDPMKDYVKAKPTGPAGGPAKNPDAVICVSYRKTGCVSCTKPGSTVKPTSCCTQPSEVGNDTISKGPTPVGEYLIGVCRLHRYGFEWFNLNPGTEDGTGYYSYLDKNKCGRNTFGFHPGQVSWGCVTVTSTSKPYDNNPCWSKIAKVIRSGNMTYGKENYEGILYVVDE